MTSRVPVFAISVLPLTLLLGACQWATFEFAGRAADEWTRSYPLDEKGQLEISNTNGLVEIEGVNGSTVEVRAERVAHAPTDSAARELLSRIVIKEEVSPTRISLESERSNKTWLDGGYEIHYHGRAPRNAVVHASTTNGRIILTALSGRTTATTTNGPVKGDAITGGITARTTNGMIDLELGALGADGVNLRTTNGRVSLTVPVDTRADLDASVTNGAINVTGLKFEASDLSRRHLSGRLNGGGAPITVSTTNGPIQVGIE